MARNRNKKMGNSMGATNKGSELRSRFLFLVGALIIFRAGTFIPVPGVDPAALAAFFLDADRPGTAPGWGRGWGFSSSAD